MNRKSRKLSQEQKDSLLKSNYIEKVGNSVVKYSNEFKIVALKQYRQGLSPVEIFTDAKIDVRIIGSKNAFNLIKKWMKEQQKSQNKDFKNLSLEKQLQQAQEKILYLEEELDFRKKLQALEEE